MSKHRQSNPLSKAFDKKGKSKKLDMLLSGMMEDPHFDKDLIRTDRLERRILTSSMGRTRTSVQIGRASGIPSEQCIERIENLEASGFLRRVCTLPFADRKIPLYRANLRKISEMIALERSILASWHL